MLNVRRSSEPSGLQAHGIAPQGDVFWNLYPAALVEHAIEARDGMLANSGALVVATSPHTGRSPKDRYVVDEPASAHKIWWGDVNQPMAPEHFDALLGLAKHQLEQADLYVQDVWSGADPAFRLNVRLISESPWHTLFARNMFLTPTAEPASFSPDWTVLHAPSVKADPEIHGTRSGTFIVLNFASREVIIGGTRYAGEIKKSIFSVMNYLLPSRDVLPMHCSANVGSSGEVALFFGLSGTGKTTLSTDPERPLIGDDEHGWSEHGVFNFEGGSYAKVIRISATDEPLITAATNRFGTIIENVVIDAVTRAPDFADESITENTRSSYPLPYLGHIVPEGRAGHARNVMFLAADAFGVLPPIARLDRDQAMFYFLSGYTAKVAGTEGGVKEPQATFSPCFGAPFLPLPPSVYADLLGRRIDEHDSKVWLVNTGWTGGPFGVGMRFPIRYTRAMIHAALQGRLDDVPTREHPILRLAVPERIPGVPEDVLDVRSSWADPAAYDAQAMRLARMFQDNFAEYAAGVPESVRASGPRIETES